MTTIYSARWVLPVRPMSPSSLIERGAVAVDGALIVGVGSAAEIAARFPDARVEDFGQSVILPGLINTHTHLELTAMRGFLENEESDFFAWLRKLTLARLERMTPDDIRVSATWGACEAVRAGITCVGDASDSAMMSMLALRDVGLRGVVFQESFGPDPRLVEENFAKLKGKVEQLREFETDLVHAGVSPHAPYSVCQPQLELIAEFAIAERLPLMMHAAESAAEESFLRDGIGLFAEGLAKRGIEWTPPGISTIQYLLRAGILETKPLLAHCIRVDDEDIETLKQTESKVAHCPKSNAKLGHGRAPLAKFIEAGVSVGLGSDSVASNNTCDMIEEARFALLFAQNPSLQASHMVAAATMGGAQCLGTNEEIGTLAEGCQADLAIVGLDGTHQLPVYDPATTLVFSSSGRDVVLTLIAGREVYRDQRVLGVDEERLNARMNEIAQKLALAIIICVSLLLAPTVVWSSPQAGSTPIFEQYGLISQETENSILDNFAIQLLNDPDLTGKVILRRGQYSEKFATKKLLRIKNYLLKRRHIPASRVSAFELKSGRDFAVELYLLPKAKPRQ